MSVMQAEVRSRIVVDGRDEGGVKVAEDADKALGKIEQSAKRTSAEVGHLETRTGSLSRGLTTGAKSALGFGESFAQGLGKIMGVVGAITLAGGLIGGLVELVGDGAWGRWAEQAKDLEATYKSVASQIRDIDVLLGRRQERTKFEVAAEGARESWEDLNQKIQDGELALLAAEKALETLGDNAVLGGLARQELTKQIVRLEDELERLAREREAIAERTLALEKQQTKELGTQVRQLEGLLGKLRQDALEKTALKIVGALAGQQDKPAPGGGGGGPSLAKQRAEEAQKLNEQGVKALRQLEKEQHEERLKRDGERLKNWYQERAKREREELSDGMLGEARGEASLTGGIRDAIGVFTDAVPQAQAFAGALGMVASQMDRVSAANDNLVEVLDRYRKGEVEAGEVAKARAEAQTTLTSAIVGSVGAVAKVAAQQIKDERARAGVLALIELGLGFATLYTNPPESVGHFTAATILGSVALTSGAGNGRGGARAAASTTRITPANDDYTRRAQAPQINHIYGGWYGNSTPQESMAGLAGRQRELDGTGFEGGAWAA